MKDLDLDTCSKCGRDVDHVMLDYGVCIPCQDGIGEDTECGESVECSHEHYFRDDVSDWWCRECDTVTDFCRLSNPF